MTATPYRSTPVFDEQTLPAALRTNHGTKAGVWGVIRVIAGRVRLTYVSPPSEIILDPDNPGLVEPEQLHFVTPLGAMKMRVEFHDQPPNG
jgi:hemoglobin